MGLFAGCLDMKSCSMEEVQVGETTMITLLVEWLRGAGIHVPSALDYYTMRAMGACISSLLIVLLLGRPYILWVKRLGVAQEIRKEDCPKLWDLHLAKEKTPTMGGGLILLGMVFSAVLWMRLDHLYSWVLILSLLALAALGARDDLLKVKYKNTAGLPGRYKLLGQLLISSAISAVLLEGVQLKEYFVIPTIDFFLSGMHNDFGIDIVSQQGSNSLAAFSRTFFFPFFKTPWVLPSFLL